MEDKPESETPIKDVAPDELDVDSLDEVSGGTGFKAIEITADW